jgi:serine protease Do
MSRKSVLAALALISIGIVFGALIVSSFSGGVKLGIAGRDVVIGSQEPISKTILDLKNTGDAFVAIAKEVTPTVVFITVTSKPKQEPEAEDPFFQFRIPRDIPQQGSGSGVVITSDGYILTNNHVVEGADEKGIKVVTNNRKEFQARIVGRDKHTDLAVIRVEGKDLPVAHLGNSDEVRVGQFVLAVGNPLGLTSTVTHGIVSAMGRNINILRTTYSIEDFIQTDAAINPGNSGGALVDISGAVIGINSAIATTNGLSQGYGFAIPINLAKKVAEDIIKYGKVARAVLGVTMPTEPMDETMAKSLGLSKIIGVLVQDVKEGSAADDVGIKGGDIILSIDGKEVFAPNELQEVIGRKHPGDEVVLSIFRDGKTIDKKATLKALSEDEEKVASAGVSGEPSKKKEKDIVSKATFENLGIAVQDIDGQIKKEYKVDNGVIVKDVKTFGLGFNRNLRNDDVITEVSKRNEGKKIPIDSATEFQKFMDDCKPGDYLLLSVKSKTRDAGLISRLVAIQIPK